MLEKIKNELEKQGYKPDDFNITVSNGVFTVTPKWFYETKQTAKQEDKPIIEDVNVTAETIVYTTQDVTMLADTVAQLMVEVATLKTELEEVKNG